MFYLYIYVERENDKANMLQCHHLDNLYRVHRNFFCTIFITFLKGPKYYPKIKGFKN